MGLMVSSENKSFINNQKNWDKIKCTPLGNLLQTMGIAPGDPNSTAVQCKSSEFNQMFNTSMVGQNKNTNMLNNGLGMLTNEINSIKGVIKNIQQQALENLAKISSKLFDIYIKIGRIYFVFIKHLKNILNIFKNSVDVMTNILRLVIALINLIRQPINYVLRMT